MKVLLTAAAAVAVLALVANAGAVPTQPGGAPGAVSDGALAVSTLSRDEAKNLGVPKAFLPGTTPLPVAGLATPNALGSCGACINTCWVGSGMRTGANTSTGSYWENDSPVWCGNGAWVTYADASKHWQTVTMWYSADGESGPFWDGGCIGCASTHFTIYGHTTWHPPFLPPSHTTLRLGIWLQAYGSASYG